MAWPRVSGGRCRCCRARALLTTLACRPMTKRRRTPSSEAASLMYVLRIHSRVFGVRWLLMTPSTCGVHHTVRGTYGTPAAGTRRRTYRGAPAARLRCVRPQEAGTRTPYGGPRTYVSARPSTSRRSVASPRRGRPPAAGRDTRICSEAGVELAGLGGDELPRCARYLTEQRLGRSHPCATQCFRQHGACTPSSGSLVVSGCRRLFTFSRFPPVCFRQHGAYTTARRWT